MDVYTERESLEYMCADACSTCAGGVYEETSRRKREKERIERDVEVPEYVGLTKIIDFLFLKLSERHLLFFFFFFRLLSLSFS